MSTGSPGERESLGSNLFVRYWRGGYSLGVSYWVFGFLTNLAAAVFVGFLTAILTPDHGYQPSRIFAFLLVLWLGIGLLAFWQIVGLWRSATRHAARRRSIGRTTFWAGAAKFMAVLAVIQIAAVAVRNAAPQFKETYRMAFMRDPDLPDYSIRLTRNRTELEIFGGLKYGLTEDFERVIAAEPEVRTVHLTSIGGRLAVAGEIRDIIKKRALATYVPTECSSACTLVFAAGTKRWMIPGAKVGFHGPAFPGLETRDLEFAKQEWGQALKEDGFAPDFVDRALAIPADDIWYPTDAELKDANVVTDIADADSFALSGLGPDVSTPALVSYFLGGEGISDALSDSDPVAFGQIASIVETSYAEGRTLLQTTSAVRELWMPLISTNVSKADDDVLIAFATIIVDEYDALRKADPKLCYDYATLGTGYDQIPPEIVAREVAENERALRTARNRPPIDQDKLDLLWETIRTEMEPLLTDEQMEVYTSGSEVRPDQYDDYCAGSIALFRVVAKLPKDEASLVMRSLFEAK